VSLHACFHLQSCSWKRDEVDWIHEDKWTAYEKLLDSLIPFQLRILHVYSGKLLVLGHICFWNTCFYRYSFWLDSTYIDRMGSRTNILCLLPFLFHEQKFDSSFSWLWNRSCSHGIGIDVPGCHEVCSKFSGLVRLDLPNLHVLTFDVIFISGVHLEELLYPYKLVQRNLGLGMLSDALYTCYNLWNFYVVS